jgi:tetratricopeptide (TPR) repeat protein
VIEAAVVVLAVAAAHGNAFAGGLQFDDWNVVAGDPRVQSLGAWWASMPGIRPLLKLSWALNHASGLGLAGLHAVNLAIHAANALLALALLRRLEVRSAPPGSPPTRAPLVAALVFALHPAQTEAVTYVSGRSASLAATFVLASALAHVAGRDGWRPRLARALSPALLACALGVKELAAALPAVLVAVELADPVRRRPACDGEGGAEVAAARGLRAGLRAGLGAALRATAAHWVVVAAALALFAASPTYGRLAGASLPLRGPWPNLLAHLHGLAWLAGQALRPDLLDADPVLPAPAGLDAVAAATAAVLAAALALGAALLRRRPAAALALLWTVLWLPFAGLVLPRRELANDRQLYLSLLGAGWLLGQGLVALRSMAPRAAPAAWRGAVALLAAAVLLLLGAGTRQRNRVYADEVAFWEAALARSPDNGRALNNLGFALAARCRVREAEAALARAADLAPDDFVARVNLRLLREGEPLGPREPRCPRPP